MFSTTFWSFVALVKFLSVYSIEFDAVVGRFFSSFGIMYRIFKFTLYLVILLVYLFFHGIITFW